MEDTESRGSPDRLRPRQRPKAFTGWGSRSLAVLDLHVAADILDSFNCSLLTEEGGKKESKKRRKLSGPRTSARGVCQEDRPDSATLPQSLKADRPFLCHLLSRLAKEQRMFLPVWATRQPHCRSASQSKVGILQICFGTTSSLAFTFFSWLFTQIRSWSFLSL